MFPFFAAFWIPEFAPNIGIQLNRYIPVASPTLVPTGFEVAFTGRVVEQLTMAKSANIKVIARIFSFSASSKEVYSSPQKSVQLFSFFQDFLLKH